VWIKPGTGKIRSTAAIRKSISPVRSLRMIINQPFGVVPIAGQYDVTVTVVGGGLSGQAGAVRTASAQALT
jgi:small subunit ribosomal protein S9